MKVLIFTLKDKSIPKCKIIDKEINEKQVEKTLRSSQDGDKIVKVKFIEIYEDIDLDQKGKLMMEGLIQKSGNEIVANIMEMFPGEKLKDLEKYDNDGLGYIHAVNYTDNYVEMSPAFGLGGDADDVEFELWDIVINEFVEIYLKQLVG